MSSAPNAETSFIQEHQTKVERSALFYLFQEVSKLEPPLHEALLDTSAPSSWLSKMSNSNPLLYEEEDERSFQASRAARRYSLSCERPCTHVKNVSEEDCDVFEEPRCECNSPWRVLSLINLHCERLLHPGGAEEEKSASSASRSSQCAPPDGEERSDQERLDCSVEPLLPENAAFAALEGLRPAGPGDALQLSVRNVDQGCDVHVHPAEETGPVPSELQEDVSAATLCSSREESSLGEVLEWSQTCTESSSQTGHLDVLFPGKEAQKNSTRLKAQVTFSSSSTSCKDQSEPAQTLDHNANITLSPRSACSRQDEELSAAAPTCRSCSPAEDRWACSGWDGLLTASPPEQNSQADPSPHQRRTRTPRKQPRPSRSADIQDPDFQGVMFRIAAELDDTKERCRLLITSKYSNELCKGVRKPRRRARASQPLRTSSSDDENDLAASSSRSKVCASCCTRKTPMWRDAEDGTPLCNACGIRYKKYRVRCVRCWHIPRKEGNSNSHCLKCGNFVKLTSAQRKHSS